MINEPGNEEIEVLYQKLKSQAEERGYYLNPDVEFTKELIKSLIINKDRYGYMSCPCRLAAGNRKDDLDIICPCDYRDIDISEFGACYCALYVCKAIFKGEKSAKPIPERKDKFKEAKTMKQNSETQIKLIDMPVWRCKVCGYLCARDEPPEECPICHADKDRFELFM